MKPPACFSDVLQSSGDFIFNKFIPYYLIYLSHIIQYIYPVLSIHLQAIFNTPTRILHFLVLFQILNTTAPHFNTAVVYFNTTVHMFNVYISDF
jgi:hypothetical protein